MGPVEVRGGQLVEVSVTWVTACGQSVSQLLILSQAVARFVKSLNSEGLTVIIIMIIIIIIIIIIALKGAIRDFFTISSLRRELSPTRTLLCPGAQLCCITCNNMSCATWYEGTAQL